MRLDKKKIEDRMKSAGILRLSDLAEAIDVTPETLSRYFSGSYKPSWDKLETICKTLMCRVDDIVTYDHPKALAPAVTQAEGTVLHAADARLSTS